MADFMVSYRRTNQYEGEGIVNHWADRGGETYAGISRVHHPRWPGWEIIDIARNDVRNLTTREQQRLDAEHRTFFEQEFWRRSGCHHIRDQDIADEVYDSAVNIGPGRVQEWLQIALNVSNRRGVLWSNVKVDGLVGPITGAAAERAARIPQRKWLVLQVLETQQRAHYLRLALADPTQEENKLGWFRLRIQQLSPPPE